MRTIEQLQLLFPDATLETWHIHVNGGGWVRNTVSIKETVYVGSNTVISGGTFNGGTFYGGYFNDGYFYGGYFNDGTFYDGTFYGGTFYGGYFYDGTFNGGTFYDGYFYCGTFYGGIEWNTSPLFIQGTQHSVAYCGNQLLKIGCHERTIVQWQTVYERVGKQERYSEEQIAEYKRYIDLAAAMYPA